jgi:membrane protease YdiL (CAAX protease family)
MAWTAQAALGTDLSTLVWTLPSFLGGLAAILLTKQSRSLNWRETFIHLGFKKFDAQRWGLGIALSTPVLVGYLEGYFAYTHKGFAVTLVPQWPFLLVWFFMGSIFFEEIVFRGYLFQALRERWAFWPAALASSFAWALAHFGNAFWGSHVRFLFPDILIFLLGLAGAYLFERTGNSIWSWAMVHMAINLVGIVDIGGAGLFLTPLGAPVGYLFGGEIMALFLSFPVARWATAKKGSVAFDPK